jgi:hypothetical protein
MKLPLSLRASNTDRRFTCHGSLLAEPRVPVRDDDGGAEGSLIHHLIAARLVAELGAVPPAGGLIPPVLPPGFRLPAFSAWIVDFGVRWVRENIPAGWSLMVEAEYEDRYELPRPVWIPLSEIIGSVPANMRQEGDRVLVDHFILTGHEDVRGLSPDGTESISADYKTGPVGADPAESSWQAGSYMGLGKLAWPMLAKSTFYLIQPKIDEEATGIKRISDATLDGAGLDRMNAVMAEEMNRALEDRYTTNSSPRSCRWCPVGKSRPYACPSLLAEKDFMKATLTPDLLAQLAAKPNDGLLGDFVISGRTLDAPVKAATELLHERIAANGYVDAACGTRLTVKTRPGKYSVVNPKGAWSAVRRLVPEDRIPEVIAYSKDKLIDVIADAKDIHKSGEDAVTAEKLFKSEIAPNMEQSETRILVLS